VTEHRTVSLAELTLVLRCMTMWTW